MSTVTMTPCPSWCRHEEADDEMHHESLLASMPAPGASSGVSLVQSADPECPDEPHPSVWIRGNGLSLIGSRDVPFTVEELRDLSLMFAKAAHALEVLEAADRVRKVTR